MAPKKGKKITLNEFLGDSSLGSWADEMDALPNAPAIRSDDEASRSNERFSRRDDFLATRPDRVAVPARIDLPLPTQPPYTAFVGNLAFDLTDSELENYFKPLKTKSVKIIRDRDDKPKGFGYIEFTDLDDLKEALSKTGSNFSGRTIRVSVAEPPKERPTIHEDGGKFDSPWRRETPLPDTAERDSSRRRYDSLPERSHASASDGANDWRSNKPLKPSTETESFKRKGSGFFTPEGSSSAADAEETWTIGGKFRPSAPSEDGSSSRFGSLRGRGDTGPSKESLIDDSDWRSTAKPRSTLSSGSPTNSNPSTPQMGRRKLELLPRSTNSSVGPSPLSSPKGDMAPGTRSNPFGAAKPVDVTSREKEVLERLEKEREAAKERLTHPMSRTNSRSASERSHLHNSHISPGSSQISLGSKSTASSKPSALSSNIRPSVSFANVAANKDGRKDSEAEVKQSEIEHTAEQLQNVKM